MIPEEKDIPLPASIAEAIQKRFVAAGDDPEPMPLAELLSYLAAIEDFNAPLLTAIAAQTEAIGDPSTPGATQHALLAWLDASWPLWETSYSLEDELRDLLRQLKPLAGALALTDSNFTVPGRHPLHRLLDTAQDSAVGWQARLGRAGEGLVKQLEATVAEARAWFDDANTDLEVACSALTRLAERDHTRAARMRQRAVETESGREKSSAAKSEAARMINRFLEGQPLPRAIGDFVKGDWYDSAQLVLLKFGMESDEWQQMQATTATLLESVQAYNPEDGDRRKQLFELATQLPRNMRRWLLSLQHDGDAVSESLGVVEFVHLRLLRQQELEREDIEPIPIADDTPQDEDESALAIVNQLETGQWLRIEAEGEIHRVQLALNNSTARQLMFTNRSGVKSLVLGYAGFAELLAQQQVSPLNSGAGFSRSLANSAGLTSEVAIAELLEQASTQHETASAAAEPATVDLPVEPGEPTDHEPALPLDEPIVSELVIDTLPEVAETMPVEEIDSLELDIPDLERIDDDANLDSGERDTASTDAPTSEFLIEEDPTLEAEDLGELAQQAAGLTNPTPKEAAPPANDNDKATETPAAMTEPAAAGSTNQTLDTGEDEKLQAQILAERQRNERVDTVAIDLVPPEQTPVAADSNEQPAENIQLAMGAWLGFHDGDTPIMARLAVHDREQGSYIFVNREGIKLRQLSSGELASLIDQGLVDILETRSNFREAVRRVRNESEQ